MSILISLVGGQPAPNLLAALKVKPETIVLIHSTQTLVQAKRQKKVFERVLKCSCLLLEVDSFNTQRIREKFASSVSYDSGRKIYFNYTSGTKPMALGIWTELQSLNASMIYVDSERGLFHISEGTSYSEEAIIQKINLNDYLESYGFSLTYTEDEQKTTSLSKLANIFASAPHKLIDEVKHFIQNDQKVNNGTSFNKLKDFVFSYGKDGSFNVELPYNFNHSLTELNYAKFFIGGWFEYYVYKCVKDADVFYDAAVNVKIYTDETSDTVVNENEIDVIAMYNFSPVFIECKTSTKDVASVIDKSTSVNRKLGGIYSQRIICFPSPINEKLVEKAQKQNIIILSGLKQIQSFFSKADFYLSKQNTRL